MICRWRWSIRLRVRLPNTLAARRPDMARRGWMARFARWHIWLGWLVAVPLILWTATGLWMVARPIDEVRGTALRAEPMALPATLAPVPPRLDGRAVEAMTLQPRVDGPVWVIRYAGGDRRAAFAATGAMAPRVDAALAARIANAALVQPGRIERVSAFAAVDAPIDLRQDRSSWQVRYTDGLNVYVDALTGEVLAVRSAQWRAFDVAWGLHIMDLQTREDSSHPLLILFAALGLAGVLMGTLLLFRRRRVSPPRTVAPD
jgi:hypothetical protein